MSTTRTVTSAPISDVIANQFQIFIDFEAHPLYYVIAALFLLIWLLCCMACCCLVHSHRKARALLAQQQKALDLDSKLFHLNEPSDTQHLDVPHRHQSHAKLSYPGLVFSTTPSLDVEQTLSPPAIAAARSAPRVYRLPSSEITANAVQVSASGVEMADLNGSGPIITAAVLQREDVDDHDQGDADDREQEVETSTSNQETSVSSHELREQVAEQLKSDPSEATLTTFQHRSAQSSKTSNGMYELMANLLKVHEKKMFAHNNVHSTNTTTIPGYRACGGRLPYTAVDTFKKPRSYTCLESAAASTSNSAALHRYPYPYPCPSSNRSKFTAYPSNTQYTPTDVIPVIQSHAYSSTINQQNAAAARAHGHHRHERTPSSLLIRAHSLNYAPDQLKCEDSALTQQQALQHYRTGMYYGYTAALQNMQRSRGVSLPPPPPPPLSCSSSAAAVAVARKPRTAAVVDTSVASETTDVLHEMFNHVRKKKKGGKHIYKRDKGSGKHAAYEYNSMDSADEDDDADDEETVDDAVHKSKQTSAAAAVHMHACGHPPLPPSPSEQRKTANASVVVVVHNSDNNEAAAAHDGMESTPLMIQISAEKSMAMKTSVSQSQRNEATDESNVVAAHTTQESETEEKKMNCNMWLSPASNQSKNGFDQHLEQLHSPLSSAPMRSNRCSQTSQTSQRTSTTTKPLNLMGYDHRNERMKLVESHDHGQTIMPTDLKSNSTVVEDTYLKYLNM